MKIQFSKAIYFLTLVSVLVLISCNKKSLTDLNKNPNTTQTAEPDYLFTGAILAMQASNYSVIAEGMQYFSTYKEVPAIGDKFYSFNGTEADFAGYYTDKLNRLIQLQAAVQDPNDVNKLSLVRILKVYEFDQLTDVAGDIPYFDALSGQGNLKPKYDTQKDIYLDMFKELDEAAAALDPSKPTFGNADLLYKGDVTKWKKFAYTLMLRLGMRLTKVDATIAKTWVQKAISGGVMTSDADIAKINYADAAGGMNPQTVSMRNGNYISPGGDNVEGGKYAATFIDYLKSTQDPRLPVISVVWVPTSPGATSYYADTSFTSQRGMISASLNTKPTDFGTYSEPSLLVLNVAAPIILMGPSESYLLMAEAALRGWYSGSTAEEAYNNGVKYGMTQWAFYPAVAPSPNIISNAQINAYLQLNPYPSGGSFDRQLEQISVQKWLTLFGNDYEIYANWRRTGYPVLTPVNYPGNVTGGKMFRRFSLPNSENLTNKTNYLDALQRQGFAELDGDNLLTRVWWDK
ncbi:SusD/RagB family nutrient-binding outer membrane lipoprotein [Ginsengibacter hankyongi]|uniref:SusD/RagB family nutrient-binding outer membrane lipoprotein n=1 Tax=Ginsengibacter hankyongi TaxID=2607284 RepID=A0A5J5IH03_9BACT|nr:SusD/RagB family nutrient-binding outer membrane lipoprotein [Ginsengibacter hankyongi]KAA9037716.1 SusD/RagB family nutrient-binding outer membrane lipoprotein [Ginsengibacter hankyongi]